MSENTTELPTCAWCEASAIGWARQEFGYGVEHQSCGSHGFEFRADADAVARIQALAAALSRPVPGDPTFCATCGHDVMGEGECGTSVVPVTEGVDLEAIETRWTDEQNRPGGTNARDQILALVAEVRALRSRLSPPTREALAAMLAEWHDQTEETWEDHIDTAEAVLAFLSSPETEGESA